MQNHSELFLAPYTVLDFTDERGEIGPMLVGDMGADVIKVELDQGSNSRKLLKTLGV